MIHKIKYPPNELRDGFERGSRQFKYITRQMLAFKLKQGDIIQMGDIVKAGVFKYARRAKYPELNFKITRVYDDRGA